MSLIQKLKKINTRYLAEMRYPQDLDRLPIDEKSILLESQQGLGIDGNIWYIAKELLTNPEYIDYKVYISAKNDKVAAKVRKLINSCDAETSRVCVVNTLGFAYYKALSSAKYLYNDNTFVSSFVKREGQIYTNTWHGTPLKTLGRYDKTHLHVQGNVQKNFFFADYLICPNKFTYECLVKDYMLANLCPSTVILNGYPRNTAFMDADRASCIKEKYNLDGKRVYAYMPTWRYFQSIPKQKEKDLITQDFKEFCNVEKEIAENRLSFSEITNSWLREIDDNLTDNEIMFVKTHLREEDNFKQNEFRHIREWPSDEETYEFLNACDVLVTDYSSVMFDYAVTGRKCVLFAYDEKEYIKNWGLHLSLSDLPFPIVKDVESLIKELRSEKSYDDEDFLYEYCRYENEDATRKLLKRTIQGEPSGVEFTVPKNDKKNVLIFVGNLDQNGVTSSLRGLLSNIDTSKNNYYLNFQGPSVSPNLSFLRNLPDEINYISRIGKMPINLKENIVMRLYNHKLISLDRFWNVMESSYLRDIRRQFGDNKFDTVVQFTGYEYKKIMMYSLMGDRRLIFVHSNMIAEKQTRNNQRLDVLKYAYNHYDKMIAVSEGMLEPVKQIAGRDVDVEVLYNLIDIDRIKQGKKREIEFSIHTQSTVSLEQLKEILNSESKVCVSAGRFSPEKGHDRLVRAFDRYWQTHQEDYLIIQGGSQYKTGYEKLLRQIRKLSSKDHIILIKRLDNPFALVGRCDASILSSYYEGFGLVLIEGDILGIPVVSVDIDGPRKFMQDNGGTLVENSEAGLVEAFELISQNKVPLMNVDYERLNHRNARRFEELL